MIERNKNLLSNARKLRKEMTPLERKLWYQFLRIYPIKVYKQKIIDSYIVDFYCDEAKLVIEVDGSQHYEPEEMRKDLLRSESFRKYGIEVIRFSNRDVSIQFQGVCEQIHQTISNRIGYDPYEKR